VVKEMVLNELRKKKRWSNFPYRQFIGAVAHQSKGLNLWSKRRQANGALTDEFDILRAIKSVPETKIMASPRDTTVEKAVRVKGERSKHKKTQSITFATVCYPFNFLIYLFMCSPPGAVGTEKRPPLLVVVGLGKNPLRLLLIQNNDEA
jgi:hypothetical protein